jgi:putative transposase
MRKIGLETVLVEDQISVRHGTELVGIARTTFYYQKRTNPETVLLQTRVQELAFNHPSYGYRKVWVLLGREGLRYNIKRIHRIWKLEGLSQIKRRTRVKHKPIAPLIPKALYKNHIWSYDMMEDRTAGGNRLRLLTVVDEFTRECLTIKISKSMTSQEVMLALQNLFLEYGKPENIRSDNGSEFVAKALKSWLAENQIQTLYIHPGSPWENSYIESFNGKLRHECLNREVFTSLLEAKMLIENWRQEYNHQRPHMSLNYQTPAAFAATLVSSATLYCTVEDNYVLSHP